MVLILLPFQATERGATMVSAVIGLEHAEKVKLSSRLQCPSIFPGS